MSVDVSDTVLVDVEVPVSVPVDVPDTVVLDTDELVREDVTEVECVLDVVEEMDTDVLETVAVAVVD